MEKEDNNNPESGDPKNKGGRPKGSKTRIKNKEEVEEFINLSTKKILTEHLSWTEYTKWCKKEGLGQKRCNHYWKICWGRVKEKFDLERDKHINKHLTHYWELYDKSLEKDDLSNSRQVLGDIVKLMGLAEPDKMDVTQELKIKFKFGNQE